MGDPENNTIPNTNNPGNGLGSADSASVGSTQPQSSAPTVSPVPPTSGQANSMSGASAPLGLPPKKSKKTIGIIAAIVVILILAAAGIVWFVLANKNNNQAGNDNPQTSDNSPSDNKNDDSNSSNSKPKPDPISTTPNSNNQLTELSLDDEVVRKVYGNFRGIARLFDGWWGFYVNDGVKDGKIDKAQMLLLAGANYPEGTCVGHYEYGNGGTVTNECASGEAIRQKIVEMFGKSVELTTEDKIGSFCGGKVYNAANDEFVQVGNGCGGASSEKLVRILVKAERSGSDLYLYEKVLLFSAQEYYHFNDTTSSDTGWGTLPGVFGEKIGEYAAPDYSTFQDREAYNKWLEDNVTNLTNTYGEEFKWTFKWNGENYVFEKIEKL